MFLGKPGWGFLWFFWGDTALIAFIRAFFRLPEPKGRAYAELDILFARKISTCKFTSTPVDTYAVGGYHTQEGLMRQDAAWKTKQ